MDLGQTIQALQQAGALWFMLLIFAFPVGSIILLYLAKLILLKGVGPYLRDWLNDYQEYHHKSVEEQVKIQERLTELANQYKLIGEGLFENRRYLDDKMGNFDRKLDQVKDGTNRILHFAKKRQSDWIRFPDTEAYRAERKQGDDPNAD